MEWRGRVDSIEDAVKRAQTLGAIFHDTYAFEDRVYFLPQETSVEKGYIRLRTPNLFREAAGPFVITKKMIYKEEMVEWYRARFSSLERAKESLKGLWVACIIMRRGRSFSIPEGKLFIEEIEEFGNSVEADVNSSSKGKEWMEKLGAKEISTQSMPLQFLIWKNATKK